MSDVLLESTFNGMFYLLNIIQIIIAIIYYQKEANIIL